MEKMIGIIKNIFARLDYRILNHGERVAYLTYMLLKQENKYTEMEIKDAVVLALLHDVGALKTDSIDNLITFDSHDTFKHCVYGYLFLKYFSPLAKLSKIILYHHTYESELGQYLQGYEKDICGLIYLADRIDVWNLTNKNDKPFFANNGHFNEKYYQLFVTMNQQNALIDALNSQKYFATIDKIDQLYTTYEIKKYLEMIVFAIDFRSYQTVTHSLLVAIIAKDLGKRLNLTPAQIRYLGFSALIHDVGKVSTPLAILEKQGKLTFDEMAIMREHVNVTADIIRVNVRSEVFKPAIRHHERLDNSGYPQGIGKDTLTVSDNIIIIADIVAALIMKRSYKEPFPKGKTIAILSNLAETGKIDNIVYELLLANYDEIINNANKRVRIQEKKLIAIRTEYDKLIS